MKLYRSRARQVVGGLAALASMYVASELVQETFTTADLIPLAPVLATLPIALFQTRRDKNRPAISPSGNHCFLTPPPVQEVFQAYRSTIVAGVLTGALLGTAVGAYQQASPEGKAELYRFILADSSEVRR